ncbi:hypothetical protein [Streptomyces caniferus]|uniref:hypothetical protein n=1 Tax=Streptomyces caniferus TaxID=285557 RepID=UPI00381BC263
MRRLLDRSGRIVLAGQGEQGQDRGGPAVRTTGAISRALPRTPRLPAVANPGTGTAMPMPAYTRQLWCKVCDVAWAAVSCGSA